MSDRIDDLLRLEDSYDSTSELATMAYEQRVEPAGWASLTDVEEAVLLVHILASEVGNGGFPQFFSNVSGNMAQPTLSVLETIGAKDAARLLAAAMREFPGAQPSTDWDRRLEQMELFDDEAVSRLENLTDEFFDHDHEARDLAIEYVRKNRARFTVTG